MREDADQPSDKCGFTALLLMERALELLDRVTVGAEVTGPLDLHLPSARPSIGSGS